MMVVVVVVVMLVFYRKIWSMYNGLSVHVWCGKFYRKPIKREIITIFGIASSSHIAAEFSCF